jgi:hypothetical protein
MNSSIIHADIFFYITTIAVIILTALLIILFYYLVKIARHLECTAMKLRKESERIIEDVSFVRESIEDQGDKAMSFLKFIFRSFISRKDSTRGRGSKNARGDKALNMNGKKSSFRNKKKDGNDGLE